MIPEASRFRRLSPSITAVRGFYSSAEKNPALTAIGEPRGGELPGLPCGSVQAENAVRKAQLWKSRVQAITCLLPDCLELCGLDERRVGLGGVGAAIDSGSLFPQHPVAAFYSMITAVP